LRAAILATALLLASSGAVAYDWLQFNGDAAHSGHNTVETTLGASNVATLALKYQVALPAVADGAPVYLANITTSSGVKDLVFVTTKAGDTVALDAATGTQIWKKSYAAGTCKINGSGGACYTTSSPAIDPNRQFVYAYGLDGKVHKLRVADGVEISGSGWPQLATTKGSEEKASSALATATAGGVDYLYVVHGGYPGDNGDYQGHVTAINLATGAQAVFNTMCSASAVHYQHIPSAPNCGVTRSAVWSRPGVIYDSATNRIFVATGNGSYDANIVWSESVLALHPDGTGGAGKPIDSYTPATWASLDSSDADLGSTSPAILPVPATSKVQHLALQGGKDAKLRLLNLANLSGQGSVGHTGGEVGAVINVPQGGGVLTQPAVWVNPADNTTWAFVANGSGISALHVAFDASGNPSLQVAWQKANGGTSPIVANKVLYYAANGVIRALDPLTGNALWSSNLIGNIHWESPIVANGRLFITDEAGKLSAFALPSGAPAITSANQATFVVGKAGSFKVTATGVPAPTLSIAGTLPTGITFTPSTGMLAGTPGAGTTGNKPLTFTATNGVVPDATQSFTLSIVAQAKGSTVTFNDSHCTTFTMTGPAGHQTLNCK
jgi:outer membrane protein assembly factor BamB